MLSARVVARGEERGIGVVTALAVLLVVSVLAATWSQIALHQADGSGRERSREQALAAAEAGLNRAMSRLAVNPLDCGAPVWPMTGTLPGVGEYEVVVDTAAAACSEDETRRYLVAKGWAPSRTAARAVGRQLEHQVELVTTDGFRYALFAAPGGITGDNNLRVNGDVYAATNITLANFSRVFGNIVALGNVSTTNEATIGGYVHAGGNVSIYDSRTTVEGDVLASGSVAVKGRIKGKVQAGGVITLVSPGVVDGTQAPSSPPPPPKVQQLPTFTWDPLNYPPLSTSTWATASAFKTWWSGNRAAFAGHHRITGPSVGTLELDAKWTLAGDATVVSDGRVVVSRDITTTAAEATLTIVSFASGSAAVEMTNAATLPPNIKVVLFAPNGCVAFRELKHFSGTVYASCIELDQQFTLTFAPVDVPGFAWDQAATSHFVVQARSFREVTMG